MKENAKTLKNEIKTDLKEKTELKAEIKTNSEAASKTNSKAAIKSETLVKNSANSEAKEKSEIKTMTDLYATSKTVTDTSVARGWVMIKGRGNLCIKTARRKRITQAACNWRNEVMWRFIKYRGKWIIQSKNGQVIDLFGKKRNNGAHINADNRNNGSNQKWNYVRLGRGKFQLKSVHSNKCLDNTGKARKGVGYHQWSCDRRNKNQQFRTVKQRKVTKKVKRNKRKSTGRNKRKSRKTRRNNRKSTRKSKKNNRKSSRKSRKNNRKSTRKSKKNNRKSTRKTRRNKRSNAPSGWGIIKGRGNLCIQTARSKRITQGSCNYGNNSLWKFIRMGNSYIILSKNGQVVDLYGKKRNNGAHIYADTRNNGSNQKWYYVKLGRGKFQLKSVHSQRCLDNTGKASKGVGYHQWSCSRRNKNQQFRFLRQRIKKRSNKRPSNKKRSKRSSNKKRSNKKPSNKKRSKRPSNKKLSNKKPSNKKRSSNKKRPLNKKPSNKKPSNKKRSKKSSNKKRSSKKNNSPKRKGSKRRSNKKRNSKKNNSPKRRGSRKNKKGPSKNRLAKRAAKRAARKDAKKKDISMKKTITIPNGKVYLASANNLCVKYKGYRKKIAQHRCLKNSATLWEMISIGGDTYSIRNSANKYLDTRKGKKNASTVSSWNKSGSYSQHWTLMKAANGKYLIQNRLSRKCLDNTGLARLNRLYWTWTCNEKNKNQQFTIISEKDKAPKFITKVVRNPKSKKFVKSVKRVIRAGKVKLAKKLIKKLKRTGKKGVAKRLMKKTKKAAKKIKKAAKIVKKRIVKLIKKGKATKAKKLKKALKKMKKAVKKVKKGGKSGRGKGKKRPNSGYKKKRNIKFMGGKYKFNLVTGKDFCSKKCTPNTTAPAKKCFKGTVQTCNSCQFKGDKKEKLGQDSEELCKTVCNAISKEKTCEFYTYIDDKKKIINKKLLNRFGRIFIKKYLKR